MRLGRKIGCLFCLMLIIIHAASADMLDCSSNRHDYAQAISELNQQSILTNKPEKFSFFRGKQGVDNPYTLVLFRTKSEITNWGELQPDILVAGPHGCYTAAYRNQETATQAVAFLHSMPDMIYAEIDAEVIGCATEEGDQHSFNSHGAQKMGFADAADWVQTVGSGSAMIAVIDSGVYPHSFLSSHLSSSGYDYVDGDEDATNDTYGHGTHVAGIIVDCVCGLPVLLKPIRVLNGQGKGSISNTVSALMEAAEDGADIINLSLVSTTHSEALEDTITYATSHGCAVVASAGNNGDLTSRYCPVHMEVNGLIVVGACTGTMDEPEQASFSNYGPSVDVYAFGSGIRSCSLSGGYTTQTGTSQAAPHVSALCALLKILYPSMNGGQMEGRVKQLAGDGEVNVPDASLLKPQTLGVKAEHVELPAGTMITLLHEPPPKQSMVTLNWTSDDPDVAMVEDGYILHCMSPGATVLRGWASSHEVVQAEITVVPENQAIHLPATLRTLEEEALSGVTAPVLMLPESINAVSPTAISESAIGTVIYHGDSTNIPFKAGSTSWVVQNLLSVRMIMEEKNIPYLLDCTEQ